MMPGELALVERMGTFVTIDGQTWMLVAVRAGRWAIFENEDERIMQLPVLDALAKINDGGSR